MKRILALLILLCTLGCGTSKVQNQAAVGVSGNWVMKAKDTNGSTFQITGVLQSTQLISQANQSVSMANVLGNASHVDASCSPYRVALSNASVNGSAFTGSFAVTSKSGQQITINANGTFAVDGTTLAGNYTLAGAAPSCFPASASGTFSGSQIGDVTGNWAGTIQPCNWDSVKSVCSNTGFAAPVTVTLSQDDVSATVTGTYKATGMPTFSSGSIGMQGRQLLSGTVLQVMWTDNNGAVFSMDARLGQLGSMTGVVVDTAMNYYSLQLLQQ